MSNAAVAMAHGINPNLARRWVRLAEQGNKGTSVVPVKQSVTTFVPVQLPAPTPAADIRIELRRGATAISVSWPSAASAACAAWMHELLK